MNNNNLYRIKRLENEIKNKICLILYKKSNDIRIKNITILKVKISLDYNYAKIFVIFINTENIEYYIKILNKSSNFFRKELFKILSLKFIPKLLFVYDYNINKSRNIINIINNIRY